MKPEGDLIRAAVSAALPPGYGAITRWGGPRQGAWSWMFEAETGGAAPATLLVKIPRWEDATDLAAALEAGPQADTEEEFRVLETIASAVASANDPGLTAVVPVTYVRAVNAIVTERLRAEPLHDRLRRRQPSDAASLFRRVGRWLRVFHATASQDEVLFGSTEAAEVAGQGRPGRGGALVESIAAVAAAARALADRAVTIGVVHGDLSLRNVLVTIDDRVAVVDPNRYRGRLTADAAHLLTEARLGRRNLVTAGVLRRRAKVEQWAGALRAGYPEMEPRLLAYERAAAAVKRWVEVEDRVQGVSSLALLPARRLFKSEVETLLREI